MRSHRPSKTPLRDIVGGDRRGLVELLNRLLGVAVGDTAGLPGRPSAMTEDQTTTQDPRTQHQLPEQPELQLEHPGHEADMTPRADHGEESYRGGGRLEGRRALIT